MIPAELFPPCSRFAPSCYQSTDAWQQWNRQQLAPLDDHNDARISMLKSIGAPPGLEEFSPSNIMDAPTVPSTPPPLPVPVASMSPVKIPCFATSLPKLMETFRGMDTDGDLTPTDSDAGLDLESHCSSDLYPHRLDPFSNYVRKEVPGGGLGRHSPDSPIWLSKGSLKHDLGKCTPCHFFQRKQGCTSGAKCRFCHLHEDMRDRPDKRKREKARKAVDNWEQQDCSPQAKGEMAARLAMKDSYTRMLVERRMKEMVEAQPFFQTAVN